MPGYFFTTLGAMSIIQVIVAIGKLISFTMSNQENHDFGDHNHNHNDDEEEDQDIWR